MSASLRVQAPSRRLSATESGANTWRPSGTCTMPARTRACGESVWIGLPSNVIAPPVIGCTPEIARSSVVLPAPLLPTSATISPFATSSETSRSTAMRP